LPVFVEYLKKPEYQNSAIVSPDVGRAGLAGKFAEALNLPLVVMHKRRSGLETRTTHVMGDIAGRRPIIVDDLIASGSVLKQLDALYEKGAKGKAVFAITHPLLLPQALINLDDDRIEELIVTNTMPIPPEKYHKRLRVLSIAPLLADVINRIHTGKSITELLVKA
jgi:ribose-phosphate pyrophosphokinase